MIWKSAGSLEKGDGAGVVSGRCFHRARREVTWDVTGGMVAREKIPKPPTVVTTSGRCGLGGHLAISKNARLEALVDVRGNECELRVGCGYG